MESWRKVWRDGFAPAMSIEALEVLLVGLEKNDPAIVQGATTRPPPLMCVQDWPVEAADAIGFAGWKGEKLSTVGEVEEYSAKMCFEADQRLGQPAACRWFLNWFDDTERLKAFTELASEIKLNLRERNGTQTSPNSLCE